MSSPEYHGRRARAWAEVLERDPSASAFLVTGLANVRYLCGFTGSSGVLLLSDADPLLGTDGRYLVQAGQQCPGLDLVLDRQTLAAVVARWKSRTGGSPQGRLALESAHLSVADYVALADAIGGVERLSPLMGVVEGLRATKDEGEMTLIRTACAISDAALSRVVPSIRAGQTERDIARLLESTMLALGADGISFSTIVGAGPNSAIPHHEPTHRPLAEGDLVVIDFGAEVGGYHADETRTFVVGSPADWQVELHALVLSAQEHARHAATAGTDLVEVDRCARGLIADAGHAERFDHGLGHGVGLEIHEAPFLGPHALGMLAGDSAVTVEPGVYLPGRGGVRIEDTVAISDGPSVPITATDRGLTVLG